MNFIKIITLFAALCQEGIASSSDAINSQFEELSDAVKYSAQSAVTSNSPRVGKGILSVLANGHQTPRGKDGFTPEQEQTIKTIMVQALSVLKDTLKPEDLTRDNLLEGYPQRDDEDYNRNVDYIIGLARQTLQEIPDDLFERFRYVGKTLPIFKKNRLAVDLCPRKALYNMLKYPSEEKSEEQLLERVYFSLFCIAGAQSTSDEMNVGYVQENYPDLLKLLSVHGCDPSFKRLANEFGVLFQDEWSKIMRPLEERHTTLILGGGYSEDSKGVLQQADNAYSVNIFSKDATDEKLKRTHHDPDLIADINSIDHMSILPSKRFETIIVEGIPAFDYYNPYFFWNMRRLLKDDGVLQVDNMQYMEQEPYFIKDRPAYFASHGFSMAFSKEIYAPDHDPRYLYLRKLPSFNDA